MKLDIRERERWGIESPSLKTKTSSINLIKNRTHIRNSISDKAKQPLYQGNVVELPLKYPILTHTPYFHLAAAHSRAP